MAQKKLSGSQKFFMKLFFPSQKAFFPKLFFSTRGIQHFVSLKVRWVLAQSQNKLTLKLLFSKKKMYPQKKFLKTKFCTFLNPFGFSRYGFFSGKLGVLFPQSPRTTEKKVFFVKWKKLFFCSQCFSQHWEYSFTNPSPPPPAILNSPKKINSRWNQELEKKVFLSSWKAYILEKLLGTIEWGFDKATGFSFRKTPLIYQKLYAFKKSVLPKN